jgi:hypothetical protein
MTTLLPFPRPPTFTPLRAFHATHGAGAVVAVLFHVPPDHPRHRHAHQGKDQQQRGQGERGAQP